VLVKRAVDGRVPTSISWQEFEQLVGEGFRQRGFEVGERGGASPDGGVDLELTKAGKRYLVQCKQWRSRQVGVKAVRELCGVMATERAQGGYVVTCCGFESRRTYHSRRLGTSFPCRHGHYRRGVDASSGKSQNRWDIVGRRHRNHLMLEGACPSGKFTREASEFAQRSRIELIDGAQLQDLIGEKNESAASNAPAFTPTPMRSTVPTCPGCGKAMVERTAKKGSMVARTFCGCQDYPRCRRIVPKIS
jgi:restriction system protein